MRAIVIGSGIAGAATAYQLGRRGVEVVLADADLAGMATAAGAGIVSPWTSSQDGPAYEFAASAAAYYPQLVAQLAEDGQPETSYEVVGGMVVSADEAELAEAHDRIAARTSAPAAGVARWLDPPQARALFPALAPDLGAVHLSGSARVDGRRLRAALLRAASARGARGVDGRAELAVAGGRVTGIRIGGTAIGADAVVVAAGAWSGELLEPLGVRIDLAPQRGQITHLALPGTDTARWPVVLPVSGHYLLAFPDSRVVAGATRETGSGFDYRVTAAGQQEVLTEALAVAPGLAGATLLETRIGFRPVSGDGAPLLGALDGHPEVLLATGFGPSGLTLAPYAGSLVAAAVLGEAVEDAAFRPDRFSGR
jgi:D-amino-acid dehydrogenase